MARKAAATAEIIEIGGQVPTNGGEESILAGEPYTAAVTIEGVADYLFHAWNVEAVEAKAAAAKGSKAKKTDDLESYVYRDDAGFLAISSEQLRMALVNAGRYRQDPRSPRKSAMDLYKSALVVSPRFSAVVSVAGKKVKSWDYEDRRRVVVHGNAITRTRPAMKPGWSVSFDIEVMLSEYISPAILNEDITKAGRFCGLGDFRPTYGRFVITKFSVR